MAGIIVGIDEVGRGALAGPVVAAAVSHPSSPIPGWWMEVQDSKSFNPKGKQLAELAGLINLHVPHGIGQASAQEIDQVGITTATKWAMERALAALLSYDLRAPLQVLVDGNSNFGHPEWTAHVKGDVKFATIAAASIIAKHARDRWMRIDLHTRFPDYGFDSHVGYGTRAHFRALRKHGATDEHRRTFKGV